MFATSTVACSTNGSSTPTLIDVAPAAQLSAGRSHTCATLRNGNLACWGKGDRGELGKVLADGADSSAAPQPVPILDKVIHVGAGAAGSCAVLEDRTVRCWGNNADGQLGVTATCNPGLTFCMIEPETVDALENIVTVVAGRSLAEEAVDAPRNHVACALDDGGLVRCWGGADQQMLGRGSIATLSTTPMVVVDAQNFPLRDITQVAAGAYRICALDIEGVVWCWGADDTYHQPGGLSAEPVALPIPAKTIAVGEGHACAVLDDGSVSCWGRNQNGECGVSSGGNDCCNGEEGFCIPGCRHEPVTVPGVVGAVGVAAGGFHTCAWLADGGALCWGSNQSLQLGNDTRSLERPPSAVTSVPGRIVEMVCGNLHTCARTDKDEIHCWGTSERGESGQ
ncbi:RCC1 domain-containing protein [Polyangium jinanense]|uniref:BNR repeat domain protein n=1 Tax=Polyangium jinanense TaxID=2829994 RepID=A0A9X3XCL0_9BACT|nr:hypothetical protein [Polyangium jinanense]MDC3960005.1 hypothetical protein [Polyangium jinanense]MDC3986223.1 hypothetical protein [Polyangium jinanense]